MSRVTLPAAAMLILGAAACDTPSAPADRSTTTHTTHQPAMAAALGGLGIRLIGMKDACDPETFAEIGCLRTGGGVTLDHFLAKLGKKGVVGAWHFAPPNLNARVGQTLRAANGGGEVHTFTEVEEFGGGIVPLLNDLSGNPEPAPECLALAPEDFVPPGATYEDEVEEAGSERYQCCIHPWMRTTVAARE
jgi:plastocyanin